MARPSKVDLCMFCGEAPCVCRAKTKAPPKPRAPRKPAVAPIAESNTRSIPSSGGPPGSSREKADVTAAMRSASKVKHYGATVKEDHDASDETTMILTDPEMVLAIQAVGPIMHLTERKRFADVLEATVEPKARAALWKARNART